MDKLYAHLISWEITNCIHIYYSFLRKKMYIKSSHHTTQCFCVCAHTHTHTHARTHARTHTHTHIQAAMPLSKIWDNARQRHLGQGLPRCFSRVFTVSPRGLCAHFTSIFLFTLWWRHHTVCKQQLSLEPRATR